MGFLDNSGDIILDAVLTDAGRRRISLADGSFILKKFALGDDEIDYGLYDKNNPNGSPYYDVTILQTPILEAFTNNTSLLKSKLVTITRQNVWHMAVMKLFTDAGFSSAMHSSGIFVVACDKATVDNLGTLGVGILNGNKPNDTLSHIRLDQGLDTPDLSSEEDIPIDVLETKYILEIDNRLLQLYHPTKNAQTLGPNSALPPAQHSFVDDDSIASYYCVFTNGNAADFVQNIGGTQASSIVGPRGTKLKFRLGSSLQTRTADYLFTKTGTLSNTEFTNAAGNNLAAGTWRFIDTNVRVTGVNTGYRVDIPVRIIKSV